MKHLRKKSYLVAEIEIIRVGADGVVAVVHDAREEALLEPDAQVAALLVELGDGTRGLQAQWVKRDEIPAKKRLKKTWKSCGYADKSRCLRKWKKAALTPGSCICTLSWAKYGLLSLCLKQSVGDAGGNCKPVQKEFTWTSSGTCTCGGRRPR